MKGEVACAEGSLRWDLRLTPRWRAPVADWLQRVPGSASMHWSPDLADARLDGELELEGRRWTLRDLPAYADHNWGSAYPRWWFWLACNAFGEHPDLALVAGGGRPQTLGVGEWVDLVSVALRHEGRAYAFHKHHLAVTWIDALPGGWRLRCSSPGARLLVEARAPLQAYQLIELPTPSGTHFANHECLHGALSLTLQHRRWSGGWRTVLKAHSELAAMEYGLDPLRPVPLLHSGWLGQTRRPARGPFGGAL